ncbi:ERF family protein [Cryobacterium sp. GrIS_2_6]|uniref:ERF family protein n=1 Tax=Cryobacterium sp. GrIS_2_6 TaxID=3162785 RepID=UPI002E03E93C|nr:hypothetical protein [Cryobacterium psychrotolerans]
MAEDFSTLNLYQKIAKITGEVGLIKKGGTNKDQGYAFIEYAAVAGELRSLFAKYGVVIVPRMQVASKQSRNEVESKYGAKGNHALIDFSFNVVNADKPEDRFTVPWTGEALSFDDKGTNKAATSALKYYLMRQFNISEKGEDPDADSPTAIVPPATAVSDAPTEEQLDRIEELAPIKGKDAAWLKLLGPKLTTAKAAAQAIEQLEAMEDA